MTTADAHLTDEQVEAIGVELDAIRADVLADLGEDDARYIHRIIAFQRALEVSGRGLLLFSRMPPAWLAGTAALSVAKILENMELGHNIMHGQWDWMRDRRIHSTTWEWDHASPSESWKQSHNVVHHTYTNVRGLDRDLGYDIMRVTPEQEWKPVHLLQPVYNVGLSLIFEWGVALYDLGIPEAREGKRPWSAVRSEARKLWRKARRQLGKDYLLFPLLSGPGFLSTLAANATANTVRNVWAHAVIFCGHFPDGTETFGEERLDGETKGQWYVRQMLGSANLSGSPTFHIMTGNLSHQIEHHLFPDLPSNRYAQIAPRVREICERYGLPYTVGSLPRQYGTVLRTLVRLALPGGAPAPVPEPEPVPLPSRPAPAGVPVPLAS